MALKKSEKKLLKILGGVAVVSGFILYRAFNPSEPESIPTTTPTSSTEIESKNSSSEVFSSGSSRSSGNRGRSSGAVSSLSTSKSTGVLLSEFENHNTISNCWVTIGDNAFNISPYLENNQLEAASIVQYCGTLGFEFGINDSSRVAEIKSQSQDLGKIK